MFMGFFSTRFCSLQEESDVTRAAPVREYNTLFVMRFIIKDFKNNVILRRKFNQSAAEKRIFCRISRPLSSHSSHFIRVSSSRERGAILSRRHGSLNFPFIFQLRHFNERAVSRRMPTRRDVVVQCFYNAGEIHAFNIL